MRRCEFCGLPISGSPNKRFCDRACTDAAKQGAYLPNPVPLAHRYPDPIWGGLAEQTRAWWGK